MKENTTEEKSVFDLIYEFPLNKEEIKSLAELQNIVLSVTKELSKIAKTNIEDVQRYCYKNRKLYEPARLLRDQSIYQEEKTFSSGLVSALITMFHTMMTENKMVQFLVKQNLPLSIYIILIRSYIKNKFDFLKKSQVIQSFKFLSKFLCINPLLFPRMFANFINSLIIENNPKVPDKNQRILLENIDLKRQNQKQNYAIILNLALELIKLNLKLAAQSGVLVNLYRKASQGEISQSIICSFIEIIAMHFNKAESRQMILRSLDLGKVFAVFTNVDFKMKDGVKNEEKIEKCALIVELLLSSWSTLLYFLQEKETLKNFILSLKSKTPKQFSIINDKIITNIINQALRYDKLKMQKSDNCFGLSSNYLNYKSLLLISYFLESTQIFQIYYNMDTKGQSLRNIGKIALKYFPSVFQKQKFNKIIVNSIRSSQFKENLEIPHFSLFINSYFDKCLLEHVFSKQELIYYLLQVKNDDIWKDKEPEKLQSIQMLLQNIKKYNFSDSFLLYYYSTMMRLCEDIPWQPNKLKIAHFLSNIVEYLSIHDKQSISAECLDIMEKIFENPKKNFCRYLYITALDDVGKYFGDFSRVHDIIFKYNSDQKYSFRITRLLLNFDYEKEEKIAQDPKKIIQKICSSNSSQELIFQVIEVIKKFCYENNEKAEWGRRILIEELIYSPNQYIASLAIEFCEQLAFTNKMNKSFLEKINFSAIVDISLRKRLISLLLSSEKGIEIINAYDPNFIKEEIQNWFKNGNNTMKELIQFFQKSTQRYGKKKQFNYMNIKPENRSKLVCLPWNIKINDKYYVALVSYKNQKQKIKLNINPEILIENTIQIHQPNIGNVSLFDDIDGKKKNLGTPIIFKREQVLRNYDKNTLKEEKEVKKFVVSKEKITFVIKYEGNSFILSKITINIPLSKDVYLPLLYPFNFFSQLSKTVFGFSIVRKEGVIQKCLSIADSEKQINYRKGALACLGQIFQTKFLENNEKIEILEKVMNIFQQTSNYQMKEITLWVLNIIIKDQQCRKKIKEYKGWLLLESKYCSWMCYPHFYGEKSSIINIPIKRFSYIRENLPEKLYSEQYKIIIAYLDSPEKDRDNVRLVKEKKKELLQFFRKKQKKQSIFNSKLFDVIMKYMAVINFSPEKIKPVVDIFQEYLQSQQFLKDFSNGFLP